MLCKVKVTQYGSAVIWCHSSHSTRCITPGPRTEGSPHPTYSGSLSTPSRSPSLLSSHSASSTHTPRVASSRRIPTCPRVSSISPPPSPSQTGRSPRRTRAPAPCSSETRSNRWSWTASRSERRPTEQCSTPIPSTPPTPVCRPGNYQQDVICCVWDHRYSLHNQNYVSVATSWTNYFFKWISASCAPFWVNSSRK